MHNILKRLSKLHLAILVSLALTGLFAAMSIAGQLSAANASPFSGVVVEETLADGPVPMPMPVKPGEPEQNGWTAWSG